MKESYLEGENCPLPYTRNLNLCNYNGTLIMKRDIEYIAYQGEEFTIEWYFDEKKHSQSQEYYRSLTKEERIQLLKLLKRMGDAGVIHDKTKETKFTPSNLSQIDFYASFLKTEK